MIEIKCSAAEKARLMEVLDTKELPCPFVGLCTELPYYKTGMTHRECIENNIKWVIVDGAPEVDCDCIADKKAVITVEEFADAACRAAVAYFQPLKKTENVQRFFESTGFAALIMAEIFDKEEE